MSSTRNLDFSKLTAMDAMDLAVLIEEEARDRYQEFADQLRTHHTPGAAGFFEKMARVEELHRVALAARRHATFGTAPTKVTRSQIFDIEAPEYDAARAAMSLRRALETCLESELKAYGFFDKAISQLGDPEAIALFKELRAEELEHRQLVEAEIARLPPDDPGNAKDYEDEPNSED